MAKNKKKYLYGYMNAAGKFVIAPKYETAERFRKGIACVSENGKYGFIDKNGVYVIVPQYDFVKNLSENIMAVRVNNCWGLIDKRGKIILKPNVIAITLEEFYDGLSAISTKWGYGFINENGAIVNTPRFVSLDWRHKGFSEGLAAVSFAVADDIYLENERWGYCNREGNLVIDYQYEEACRFSEGLAAVKLGGKWGYIDEEDNFILKPIYDSVLPFCEGMATVMIGEKWGCIDSKGDFVIEPMFERKVEFFEDFACVNLGGKYGCINRVGNMLIEPKFDDEFIFDNNGHAERSIRERKES
jgi:hypothetical protein